MAIKEWCWEDVCPFWREFSYYLSAYLFSFIIANCDCLILESDGYLQFPLCLSDTIGIFMSLLEEF